MARLGPDIFFNDANEETCCVSCAWSLAALPHIKEAQKATQWTLEQKIAFQIGALNPHGVDERFN